MRIYYSKFYAINYFSNILFPFRFIAYCIELLFIHNSIKLKRSLLSMKFYLHFCWSLLFLWFNFTVLEVLNFSLILYYIFFFYHFQIFFAYFNFWSIITHISQYFCHIFLVFYLTLYIIIISRKILELVAPNQAHIGIFLWFSRICLFVLILSLECFRVY